MIMLAFVVLALAGEFMWANHIRPGDVTPVPPDGTVTWAEYTDVMESRVECANERTGVDGSVGLVQSGRLWLPTFDSARASSRQLHAAWDGCATPEGVGIERAWKADLTPADTAGP